MPRGASARGWEPTPREAGWLGWLPPRSGSALKGFYFTARTTLVASPVALQAYAATVVPLLFAPELSSRPGLLLNQGGHAILPSPQLKDPQVVGDILRKSRELIARALAAQPAAAAERT